MWDGAEPDRQDGCQRWGEHVHGIEDVRTHKKHRTVSKKVSDAEVDAIAIYVATLGGS